jgi:hypothetical protein
MRLKITLIILSTVLLAGCDTPPPTAADGTTAKPVVTRQYAATGSRLGGGSGAQPDVSTMNQQALQELMRGHPGGSAAQP